MGKKEDKKLTKDQAQKKIQTLKKDLFNIRFKKINNQIENPAQYNEIKKNIARLYTTIKSIKWQKKVLKGIVTSAKNNKTVVVEVTRKFKHPFYEKIIKRTKKYHAHDENNKFKEGEKVAIIECKPISKKKTWQVIKIMIQVQTELMVADNTGARRVECIKVLGGSKRRYASVGDLIVISVKDAIPKEKLKGTVHKAVVVRTRKGIYRDDGSKVQFDANAVVLTDEKGEPIGTKILDQLQEN